MEVGDNFELFKVLKTSLKHYEKTVYVNYYRRNSITVQRA